MFTSLKTMFTSLKDIPCVMCHILCVMCHVSCVTCHKKYIKIQILEIFCGGSVINRAYSVQFCHKYKCLSFWHMPSWLCKDAFFPFTDLIVTSLDEVDIFSTCALGIKKHTHVAVEKGLQTEVLGDISAETLDPLCLYPQSFAKVSLLPGIFCHVRSL